MKKNNHSGKSFMILISALLCVNLSCTKEKDVAKETPLPSYANELEVNEEMKTISFLSLEERKTLEEEQNFCSFGRKCDEFYLTIRPEDFNSIDEVRAFVAQHSEYIELVKDEEGEYTLLPLWSNNPTRYLVNEEKQMRVNGSIYTLEKNAIISLSTEKKHSYANLSYPSMFSNTSVDSKDFVTPHKESPKTKAACAAEVDLYNKVTNGRDRTTFGIKVSMLNNGAGTHLNFAYNIQPYYKTAGVWFWCNRTISYDFFCQGELVVNGHRYPFTAATPHTTDGPQKSLVTSHIYTIIPFRSPAGYINMHRYKYQASTPSAAPVTFSCNM